MLMIDSVESCVRFSVHDSVIWSLSDVQCCLVILCRICSCISLSLEISWCLSKFGDRIWRTRDAGD